MFNQEKGYKLLGKGAQAIVISVENKDGKKIAIKKPVHPTEKVESASGIINMKELHILAHIKHPYIQSAEHIFFKDPFPTRDSELERGHTFDRVFFGMELAEYSLHELIHDKSFIISNMKRAMFQMACAVQYLHGQGICHRDIKPGNVLCYFERGILTCRLADFGMTKPLNAVAQNSLHAGTSYYRAPEIMMRNRHYSYAMDVWSLGCTFFEMMARRPMFKADGEIQLLMSIFSARGSPNQDTMDYMGSPDFKISIPRSKGVSLLKLLNLTPNQEETFTTKDDVFNNMHNPGTLEEYCRLLDGMLQVDPRKRIDMDQVLLHDFFKGHFEKHPYQHNLWKPNKTSINLGHRIKEIGNVIMLHPKNHPSEKWEIGLQEISLMEEPHSFYTTEISYSIKFLAVDIFNRVLIRIKPEEHPVYYKKLGWASTYIASKYYLDSGSAHLWDLFPESPSYMNSVEIQETEKRIIELLECEIYRPNLFTFIENPCFYSSLYALAMYPNFIYNKRLAEVMNIFNNRVTEFKTKNPGINLPL